MENLVKVKVKRPQTVGEEIANAVSHGVVALFGIYVLVALILKATTGLSLFAAILYGISFIVLFLMSCLYHSLSFTRSKGVFKRFDHISIFLLIGGTFAPFLLLLPGLRTPFLGISWLLDTGWMLFIIQWVFIILGVIFKAIWVNKFQSFHYLIYIVLGWSALTFVTKLYTFSEPAFWLILSGGIAYTVGTVFYALSRIKYFHFVWHIFVALGAILHFLAIFLYLY
jgi:hemolysin III